LPEVVGDAALAVDPFDIDAIAEAIKLLINNSQLREELNVKGQKRAAAFDWQETARRTLMVYEEAAQLSL
jgi:glycosyltransferase involved in cell wall biosynthesis